ncbi:hypothetical protein HDU76_006380, partial [Blyttiomyces sp. JEL0837]
RRAIEFENVEIVELLAGVEGVDIDFAIDCAISNGREKMADVLRDIRMRRLCL